MEPLGVRGQKEGLVLAGTRAQRDAPVRLRVPALSVSFPCRYMVDAADQEKIEASKNELHNLLDKPQLQGIPVSCCLGRAPCGGGSPLPTGSRGGIPNPAAPPQELGTDAS